MELLPSHPSNDLVTRNDMFAMATELRGEMAELRAEMHLEFARLQKWAARILAANGAALIAALVT